MQCKIHNQNYENIKFVEVITDTGKLCIYKNHVSIAGSGAIIKLVLNTEEIINLNLKGVFYYDKQNFHIVCALNK